MYQAPTEFRWENHEIHEIHERGTLTADFQNDLLSWAGRAHVSPLRAVLLQASGGILLFSSEDLDETLSRTRQSFVRHISDRSPRDPRFI
jgi:hypothetical protein